VEVYPLDASQAGWTDLVEGTPLHAAFGFDSAGEVQEVTVGGNTGAVTVTVPAHERIYPTLAKRVTVPEQVLTGFSLQSRHYIAYDDDDLDGVGTWIVSLNSADAYSSDVHQYRHHIAYVDTPSAGGTGGDSGGSGPPGTGGWDADRFEQIP
jgi:hypothetical protein